jgi:hypothetical protein
MRHSSTALGHGESMPSRRAIALLRAAIGVRHARRCATHGRCDQRHDAVLRRIGTNTASQSVTCAAAAAAMAARRTAWSGQRHAAAIRKAKAHRCVTSQAAIGAPLIPRIAVRPEPPPAHPARVRPVWRQNDPGTSRCAVLGRSGLSRSSRLDWIGAAIRRQRGRSTDRGAGATGQEIRARPGPMLPADRPAAG